jgi:hypothetical protein
MGKIVQQSRTQQAVELPRAALKQLRGLLSSSEAVVTKKDVKEPEAAMIVTRAETAKVTPPILPALIRRRRS